MPISIFSVPETKTTWGRVRIGSVSFIVFRCDVNMRSWKYKNLQRQRMHFLYQQQHHWKSSTFILPWALFTWWPFRDLKVHIVISPCLHISSYPHVVMWLKWLWWPEDHVWPPVLPPMQEGPQLGGFSSSGSGATWEQNTAMSKRTYI